MLLTLSNILFVPVIYGGFITFRSNPVVLTFKTEIGILYFNIN